MSWQQNHNHNNQGRRGGGGGVPPFYGGYGFNYFGEDRVHEALRNVHITEGGYFLHEHDAVRFGN